MRRSSLPRPEVEVLVAALRSVLRFELGLAARVDEVPDGGDGPALARGLARAAARHRVAQVLAAHAGDLGFGPATAGALREASRESTLAAMALSADTVTVSRVLADAGIRHLVLKGVALSVQTTGSAAARGGGDVDLLVDLRDLPEAVDALAGAGLARDEAFCPDPGSPLFPAAARVLQELVMWHAGREVDVHWRLDIARDCLAWPFEGLHGTADEVEVAGAVLLTPDRPHAAVFNASHGAKDAWSRLGAVVDQARLERGLDPAEVRRIAVAGGAGRRLDLAHAMVARLVGGRRPQVDRATATLAEWMWQWTLAGDEPRDQRTPRATVRNLAANLGTYDSGRATVQRAGTTVWPVREMATRRLGDRGDAHPMLYALATPYFLPARALRKSGMGRDRDEGRWA